jgi:hypothetical protein
MYACMYVCIKSDDKILKKTTAVKVNWSRLKGKFLNTAFLAWARGIERKRERRHLVAYNKASAHHTDRPALQI